MSTHKACAEINGRTNATLRLHSYMLHLMQETTVICLADFLPEVFGVSEVDKGRSLFKAYAVLHRLIEMSQREAEFYLTDDVNFYTKEFPLIRDALSPRVSHSHWQSQRHMLKSDYVTALEHNARELLKLTSEEALDKASVDSIRTAVDDLSNLIGELSISEVAKHKLRSAVRDLRAAVDEYCFWGISEVEIKFNITAARTAEGASAIKADSPDIWDSMAKKMQVIALIMATVTQPTTLVLQYLLPPPSHLVDDRQLTEPRQALDIPNHRLLLASSPNDFNPESDNR